MITEETSMEISVLRKQGYSLRGISKMTGHSVNTVRKYITGQKPLYKGSHRARFKKLEKYRTYIENRMKAVYPNQIPAPVIFREIKELGYTGQIRQLYYFIAMRKPKAIVEPIIRFETSMGEQMQVDWAHFQEGGNKLYAFVAILGFSRIAHVKFCKDMKLETLLSCHQSVFEHWGGVPREVLYDNMKTVVVKRDCYGKGCHKLQGQLKDFAKYYGFMPCLCQPYRAKTKGKVERFIGYLRRSFFIPLVGRLRENNIKLTETLVNLEVNSWLSEVANLRMHKELKECPMQRFYQEQRHLQRLPKKGYLTDCVDSLCWHPIIPLQHDLSGYEQFSQGKG